MRLILQTTSCNFNGTFDLGLGISGLRTGPLLGFAADPLSGLNFLFDVMLSRMFATRC